MCFLSNFMNYSGYAFEQKKTNDLTEFNMPSNNHLKPITK
jgi:hypothetical protein